MRNDPWAEFLLGVLGAWIIMLLVSAFLSSVTAHANCARPVNCSRDHNVEVCDCA